MIVTIRVDGVFCTGCFNRHYGGFDLHTVKIVDANEMRRAMAGDGLQVVADDNMNLVTWTAHNAKIGRLDDCALMEYEWIAEPTVDDE